MRNTEHTAREAFNAVRDARRKLSAALLGAAGNKEAYNLAWNVYERLLPAWKYLNQHCGQHGTLLEPESFICPHCEGLARNNDAERHALRRNCKRCAGSGVVLYALPQETGSGEWMEHRDCPECQG